MRKLLFVAFLVVLVAGLACSKGQRQTRGTDTTGVSRAPGATQGQPAPVDTTGTARPGTTSPDTTGAMRGGAGQGHDHAESDTTAPRSSDTTAAKGGAAGQPGATSGDKGIGPVKSVKLGPIDQNMVKQGQTLFTANCTSCHDLDAKKVGPPLRPVAKTHTPEFIMNMILNPVEMEQKNAEVKGLVKQYNVTMPNLNLKQDQARAIYEYLRNAAQGQGSSQ